MNTVAVQAEAQKIREKWRSFRQSVIGGTDAAAIVGKNRFKTPVEVWLSKSGLAEDQELVETPAMRWGKKLEPVLADTFRELNPGLKLVTLPENGLFFVNRAYPFIGGTPDGLVIETVNGNDWVTGFAEFKTTSRAGRAHWGEAGDEIPENYLIQCAHNMMAAQQGGKGFDMPLLGDVYKTFGVTLPQSLRWNVERVHVLALFGGQEDAQYCVDRDKELWDVLFENEDYFWSEYVLGQQEPPLDSSVATEDYFRSRFPRATQPIRQATAAEILIVNAWRRDREALKAAEKIEQGSKNVLLQTLKDLEGLEGPFGVLTYKNNKDSEKVNWEGLANSLKPTAEQIAAFREIKQGARVLRPKFVDEDGE